MPTLPRRTAPPRTPPCPPSAAAARAAAASTAPRTAPPCVHCPPRPFPPGQPPTPTAAGGAPAPPTPPLPPALFATRAAAAAAALSSRSAARASAKARRVPAHPSSPLLPASDPPPPPAALPAVPAPAPPPALSAAAPPFQPHGADPAPSRPQPPHLLHSPPATAQGLCAVRRVSSWLSGEDAAALARTCSEARRALRRLPVVVVTLLWSTARGRCVALGPGGRLPRVALPAPSSAIRGRAVAAAQAGLARLCLAMAAHTCFLAADLPASPSRADRCLVTVCAGHGPLPAPGPGLTWVSTATVHDLPEAPLVGRAIAAAGSLRNAPRYLPHTAVGEPPSSPAPPASDPAVGMAAAAHRLEAALAASPSPYVQSWSASVGALDIPVLAATPPSLRSVDPAVRSARWRLHPLTPRYAPPVTTPYRYPTNGSPPPTFNPVCARDLWLPSSWARLTAWEAKHWSFIRDCSDRGAAAKRGTIPTEIFTQLDLMPAARGVVWDIRGGRPLPLNFDLPT